MIGTSSGAALAGPRHRSRTASAALAGTLALALLAAGPAGSLTPQIPKSMPGSYGGSMPFYMSMQGGSGFPTDVPPPPAPPAPGRPPQGNDPWSGVLFNTPDPWAPGSVPPRAVPRPAVPGAPGSTATPPRTGAGLTPAAPVPLLGPAEKPSAERLQALYRQALVHWASGQSDLACDEVIALETRVVRDAEAGSTKVLLRAEERVIDEVAANDLEVLVPIARLHFEVYRRYLNEGARGHALVENHSRTMVHDLAVLYRKQSGSEGATLVASHLLTSLGELLQHGAQHQSAAELYTEAAQLDPHNLVPALSLAIIYEKFEQYKSAADWSRRVLALDPKHPEARLRLAVNLARLHDTAEARKLLEGLTAEPSDSWVTPLAFQELARLDERREAFGKAEEELRAGIARFPQSIRIRVQLAAVLDRRGKIREARQVIQEVPGLQADAHEAARFRYNASSSEAVAVSRNFFEENASARMRVLAEALARTSAAPAQASVKQPQGQP